MTDPYYAYSHHNGHLVLSNSLLSSRLGELEGRPEMDPKKAENYRFGSLFHQALLEPAMRVLDTANERDYMLVSQMIKSCYKELGTAFFFGKQIKKEHAYIWRMYGKWWKCKIDHRIGQVVNDFKTTAATSQEEFERNANLFNYDRQCFIYMQGTKTSEMNLIGVGKSAPHDLYFMQVTRGDAIFESGREKTERALTILKL